MMSTLERLKSDTEKQATIEVDPELAQALLDNTIGNRQLRKGAVERYAREMRAKLWNTEAPIFIMVDQRGRLIDGHHRLAALVKADVTMKLRFMLGVDPRHVGKLDGGEARSLGDRFTAWCQDSGVRKLVQGSPHRANQAAAVVSFIYIMLTGQKKPSLESAIRIVRHYSDSIVYAIDHCGVNKITRRAAFLTAVAVAHNYVTQPRRSGIVALNNFVEGVVSGEMLEAGEPAYTMRRYLIAIASEKGFRDNRSAKTDSQWVIFVKALRSIQYALEGRLLHKLQLPDNTTAAIEYFTGSRRELAKALRLDAEGLNGEAEG